MYNQKKNITYLKISTANTQVKEMEYPRKWNKTLVLNDSAVTQLAKQSDTLLDFGFGFPGLNKKLIAHLAHKVLGVRSHKIGSKIPRARQPNFERHKRTPSDSFDHLARVVQGPQLRFGPQILRFQHLLGLRHRSDKPVGGNIGTTKPIEHNHWTLTIVWSTGNKLQLSTSGRSIHRHSVTCKVVTVTLYNTAFCTRSRGHDRNQCQIPTNIMNLVARPTIPTCNN